MPFKPNYNQQRADRNRSKAQKKQEKLKRLEEETAKRKAARGEAPGPTRRKRTRRRNEKTMAKKQQARASGFVLFDVFYEDGSQTSNRKVPAADLGGLDGDLARPHFRRSTGPGNRRDVGTAARPHQVDRALSAQGREPPPRNSRPQV